MTDSQQNEKGLQQLAWGIESSVGQFKLILARCNYAKLRDRLIQRLREMSQVEIQLLVVQQSRKTLYTAIREQFGENIPGCVMVVGLETVQDLAVMLTSANQVREEFRKNFAFPLVLWIDDEIYKQLMQVAPDLESWATTRNFAIAPAELIDFLQQTAVQLFNNYLNINLSICAEIKSAWQDLQYSGQVLEPELKANCDFLLGLVEYIDKNLDSAIEYYHQSLVFWQSINNLERQGEILRHITLCYYEKARKSQTNLLSQLENSDWQNTKNSLQQCLEAFKAAQRLNLVADSIDKFGIILRDLQDWEQLQNLAECALQVHKTEDNQIKIAQDYGFLAEVSLAKGNEHYAESIVEELLQVASKSRDRELETSLAKANWNDAKSLAQQALELLFSVLDGEIADKSVISYLHSSYLFILAQAQLQLEQYPDASANLELARKLGVSDKDPHIYINILNNLQQLYFQQQQYLKAFEAKLERRSIEQQFGLRAFIGAGWLQATKKAFVQTLQTASSQENIAPEIAASGRQIDVERLIERIGRPDYKLIVIHGPSGVGKSSLVNAGLVPALKNQAIGFQDNLPVAMRVYTNWVEELGRVLGTDKGDGGELELDSSTFELRSSTFELDASTFELDSSTFELDSSTFELDSSTSDSRSSTFELDSSTFELDSSTSDSRSSTFELDSSTSNTQTPNSSLLTPHSLLSHLRKNEQRNLRTVLIFDQFEEFFFVYTEPAQRKQFFEFLGECLNVLSLKVILSLRVDYIHYLLECNDLPSLKIIGNDILSNNVLYKLGNFSPADAKLIIQRLTENANFLLEPALVEQLVQDLAGELGEVRPIELQVVGAQLQTENITTLAEYQQRGTKEELVKRYLEEVVKDCGVENQQAAEILLYLLTDDKGTRPLKTRAELERDLQEYFSVSSFYLSEIPPTPLKKGGYIFLTPFLRGSPKAGGSKTRQDKAFDISKLDLILEIFVKSGLVVLLPENPADRYQLVHDYIAAFIRQQQEPKLKQVMAELEKEREQRKLSEAKLNGFLKRALFGSVAAGVVLAGLTFTAWDAAQRAEQERKQAEISEINALANSSATFFASGQIWEALTEGLKAGGKLKNAGKVALDTQMRVVGSLQKAVYLQPENKFQELNTLEGHSDRVYSVVFSPDGQRLASASYDKTIKFWDVATGKPLQTLTGHSDRVISVVFSPDGQRLASASDDKTIKLWDVATGKAVQTLTGHSSRVISVVFSPDGQRLASASDDKTIKLWDVATGKAVQTLTGHSSRVRSVVFSPDGQRLASASDDKTIKLWDVATGKAVQTLTGHRIGVMSVVFSPDGQRLASASDDNTIKLWNVATGKAVQTLTGHSSGVISVVFSPDGQRLASASDDKTIKLWDVATGKAVQTLTGHSSWVISVVFSPDGQRLASASDDKTIKLWDVATGKPLQTLTGHSSWVMSVVFSPDGQRLASASYDKTIKLWDVATGKAVQTLTGHSYVVSSVVFSPDGQRLASASYDKTIELWDVATGEPLQTLTGHSDAVISVVFSPDGQRLASASDDKTIKLWDVATGKAVQTLTGHRYVVSSVVFSPDGQRLASASADKTIKLWDVATGKPLQTLTGHSSAVSSVVFSPDGQRLASASADNTIKLWDVATGKPLQTLTGHSSAVSSVVFSPDGQRLASASDDKTIKLWDVATGKPLQTLTGHSSAVSSVVFSPDGQRLASASDDKTIIIWNLDLNKLVKDGCSLLNNYLVVHPEVLQELTECQTPPRLVQAATVLVIQGEKLARNEDVDNAVVKFRKAQQWDANLKFEPQVKAQEFVNKGKAERSVAEGNSRLEEKKFKEALAAYTQALKFDPKAEIPTDSWNTICWDGSLQKQAADVLPACDKAVALAPEDANNRDSRGLARALTGDTQGAITDFEAYIAQTEDKDSKAQRQRWVKDLRAGKNPFTDAEIKKLRN